MPIRLEMVVVWSVVGERIQNSAKKAENVELKLELGADILETMRRRQGGPDGPPTSPSTVKI